MINNKYSINLQIHNFRLPVIYITDISLKNTQKNIKEKIQQTYNVLKHTPVLINVSQLTYKSNWQKLYQIILDTQLHIIGVCSCNDKELKNMIIKSGLPILTENKLEKYKNNHNLIKKQKKIIPIQQTNNTQLVHQPVRSGQKIYAKNTDLIIINNVSPGAEIISDGNIHIYGTMRGRILAGASGNKNSQIFCTHFFPELASINGHYLTGDRIPKKFIGQSVRLHLQNDTLVIHSL